MALNLGFGKGADNPVNKFSLFKEKQHWYALGGKLRGGHRVFVHIEFCNLNPAYILRSKLIENWGYHVTGAAPGCPAIDHNWVWTGKDLA